MKLYTTRTFSAAHFLPNYIGPCSRMHGHTWKVEVWITGAVDPKTGMLVDFKDVKNIIDVYDHGVINDFLTSPPTAENIVKRLCFDIFLISENIDTVTVRVWESANSYAEEIVYREDEEEDYCDVC